MDMAPSSQSKLPIEATVNLDQEACNTILSSCLDILNELSNVGSNITDTLTSSNKNITEAILSASSKITNSTERLDLNINTSISQLSSELSKTIISANDGATLNTILVALFITFVGAFSAFIFNFLHWRKAQKVQTISNHAKQLIDLIERLEQSALDYWVSGYDPANAKNIQISEVEIKTTIRQINKLTRIFTDNLKVRRYSFLPEQLDSIVSDIYDTVTGDGFESSIRAPSKFKASKIARECSNARVAISSLILEL